MLKAFSNLNHRFQTIVNHLSIPFKLTNDDNQSISAKDYCEKIILPNRHRLLSLHIESNWNVPYLSDFFYFDPSFERLESLRLTNLSTVQILFHCIYLVQLPRLYSLKISLDDDDDSQILPNFDLIYRAIFSLPVLKHCEVSFSMDWFDNDFSIVIPKMLNQKATSIECLCIDHPASISNIFSLLEYTPKIRYLKCEIVENFDEITENLVKMKLPFLKQISIRVIRYFFDKVETCMHCIGEQVEILKLQLSDNISYMNAARWERAIKKDLPRLKVLDIVLDDIVYDEIESIYALINPFYSQFWFERGWFTTLSLKPFYVTIHIRPYK